MYLHIKSAMVFVNAILTEVGGFSLTEITVKVCTMGLFEASAEPKIRELNVSSRIQKQVIRLDVPVKTTTQLILIFHSDSLLMLNLLLGASTVQKLTCCRHFRGPYCLYHQGLSEEG
jgi:hypothetical protein